MTEDASISIIVQLERPAKIGGGDRYKGNWENGNDFQIYIPQFITRTEGFKSGREQIIREFEITFRKTI